MKILSLCNNKSIEYFWVSLENFHPNNLITVHDHCCQSRRLLHQVSLCCFLLLSRAACFCLWPVWWGGPTASIGLWQGLKEGLGYWTEDSVGAASVLASQGLVGMRAWVCVFLRGRVACMCVWQCVGPVAEAGPTWCNSKLWPGPSNMNLFCFTLVGASPSWTLKMMKMMRRRKKFT